MIQIISLTTYIFVLLQDKVYEKTVLCTFTYKLNWKPFKTLPLKMHLMKGNLFIFWTSTVVHEYNAVFTHSYHYTS